MPKSYMQLERMAKEISATKCPPIVTWEELRDMARMCGFKGRGNSTMHLPSLSF